MIYFEKIQDEPQKNMKEARFGRFQLKRNPNTEEQYSPPFEPRALPQKKLLSVKCCSPKGDMGSKLNSTSEWDLEILGEHSVQPQLQVILAEAQPEHTVLEFSEKELSEHMGKTHTKSITSGLKSKSKQMLLIPHTDPISCSWSESQAGFAQHRFGDQPGRADLRHRGSSELNEAVLITSNRILQTKTLEPSLAHVPKHRNKRTDSEDEFEANEFSKQGFESSGRSMLHKSQEVRVLKYIEPSPIPSQTHQQETTTVKYIEHAHESNAPATKSELSQQVAILPSVGEAAAGEEEEVAECSVCCAAKANTVCLPCGHGGACSSCVTALMNHAKAEAKQTTLRCLICKEQVVRVLRVHEQVHSGLVLVLGELPFETADN